MRFLRRHDRGRGQRLNFGGVAETFVARNRGPRVQAMEIGPSRTRILAIIEDIAGSCPWLTRSTLGEFCAPACGRLWPQKCSRSESTSGYWGTAEKFCSV